MLTMPYAKFRRMAGAGDNNAVEIEAPSQRMEE